ncbi:hypothetical protein [Streptomyces sp. MOE7]|uniref:hypothetical protein n=1 Tax=Streptomyces sp. MOE7 TaxID=1961713 RepID=UPI001F36B6EA|nr:hypothetical protein [Streptomyces sp. MOE7]
MPAAPGQTGGPVAAAPAPPVAAPGPMPAAGPMPSSPPPLPSQAPAGPPPTPAPAPAPASASQPSSLSQPSSAQGRGSYQEQATVQGQGAVQGQVTGHGQPTVQGQAPSPGRYGRTGLPARTPVSVPLLPPELADGQLRPRRGDPLARRAGRALRRVFASSPAAETAAVTQAAYAIQQPVTSGRQIAVSSIRGGAGKSTVAALLALTYAHYRSDPVLAVEADPALGTLPHRLGAREVRWSGSDLAQIVDPSMLITDLTGYLLPFAGGGWLLPGSQGSIGTRLDIDTYRVVMTSLRRHFAATVVDCETLPAEVARTALVTTQARVLVTPATPEGVAATRSVLNWIGGLHPGLLPTTVVVLTHPSPDSGVEVRRAAEHLGAGGAAVLPLPYDRHLAAGGAIRTELLGERTREAAARIAAEAMDRAVSRDPGRRPQQPAPSPPAQAQAPAPAPSPAPPQAPVPVHPRPRRPHRPARRTRRTRAPRSSRPPRIPPPLRRPALPPLPPRRRPRPLPATRAPPHTTRTPCPTTAAPSTAARSTDHH